MTGETGAGKSILVDALGLALGDRADATAVRAGCKRAEISAVFECPSDHPSLAWLRERGLDDDDTCCLRRLISAEGRSRAFVNNQPVTLQDLRALGALLLDIHGQHAHQSLVAPSIQRQMLDVSGGLKEQSDSVAKAFRDWQEKARELRDRSENSADREAQLDLLRFQLVELNELDLKPDEIESLRAESQRLANVDRLLQGLNSALNQLYESDLGSAYSQIVQARQSIEPLVTHDETLSPIVNQLAQSEIELKEAASELSHYRDRLEADPTRLELVEARLDRIQHLARRHRTEEAELVLMADKLESEIAKLDSGAQSLDELMEQTETSRSRYFEAAEKLSLARRAHASNLSAETSTQLKELGMPTGEFRVRIETKPEKKADISGIDDIEFQVQINPGQDYAPISRVASGGELSRISLALEVVATNASPIPTFVFDEVDTGIGGGVAEIVGRRLRQVAQHRQVLCVTHLPQVASQGSEHYRISKLTDGKSSRTQVRHLSADERIEELSRMLGGVKITAATRAHAKEMIKQAAGAEL